MLFPVILSALSVLALAFAVRVAVAMVRDKAAASDRIARAVRPVHGRSIMGRPPVRSFNRPGDN